MKCTVIGFRNVKFTPEDSGREIIGTSLYVTYPDDKVTGAVAEKLFVGELAMGTYIPMVNDKISVEFNRYGKVGAIEHVK